MRSGTLEYWEDGTETDEKQKGYYGYSQKLKHIVRLPFTTIGYDILKTILTYKGSMHPCKHAHVIKKIIEVILSSGAELEVGKYLFLLPKVCGLRNIPTIEYDYTMDFDLGSCKKGIWIPYVDKNIKPVVGMCFDTLDEAPHDLFACQKNSSGKTTREQPTLEVPKLCSLPLGEPSQPLIGVFLEVVGNSNSGSGNSFARETGLKDINEEVTVKDIEKIFVEKGIWIPYVDKNIKPVVGMCLDTLDEAMSFTSIILDLEDLVFKNHQCDIVDRSNNRRSPMSSGRPHDLFACQKNSSGKTTREQPTLEVPKLCSLPLGEPSQPLIGVFLEFDSVQSKCSLLGRQRSVELSE
ncbi:Autophagy-related protein 3 [Acorus calamus]|uniref:Autophagy-related protein 3 n=1 Tax=Acorus calamus TaxID=4465 RepID=A0AAV9EMK9_ACOCL|nr:Autophagy-related protein 3 [Acorus calamus]